MNVFLSVMAVVSFLLFISEKNFEIKKLHFWVHLASIFGSIAVSIAKIIFG